jgi:hypothetical protein
VREVWVIDRDTRRPEIFELIGSEFHPVEPSANGWTCSRAANVEMRVAAGDKLEIRIADQEDTVAMLP